jgi:hypothetical protein
MRGRLHDNIDQAIAVRIAHHLLDRAHRQPARKDQVAARREHAFARLDALIGRDADNLKLSQQRRPSKCRECA